MHAEMDMLQGINYGHELLKEVKKGIVVNNEKLRVH